MLSSKNEDFADVLLSDGKEIPAPDIGSLANGTDKSNVLLEKRSIIFSPEATAKSAFFLNAMKDAARFEPLLIPCIRAIENPERAERIRQLLDREKIKPGDRISGVAGVTSLDLRSLEDQAADPAMTNREEKAEFRFPLPFTKSK